MKKEQKKIPFNLTQAIRLVDSHGIKLQTIDRWQRDNEMPQQYFIEREKFQINGKTLTELRVENGLKQIQFIQQFKEKFGINLSEKVVSDWETGKVKPKRFYHAILVKFYE